MRFNADVRGSLKPQNHTHPQVDWSIHKPVIGLKWIELDPY